MSVPAVDPANPRVNDVRTLVAGTDTVWFDAVHAILAAQLPGAACFALDLSSMRAAPNASAIVIDARSDAGAASVLASRLRAMGFEGALLLVGPQDETLRARAKQLGLAIVAPDRMADDLISRLSEQVALAGTPHAHLVMHARRLVAAGEVAQQLQHALNNPLMALLAEAQLMELDHPSDEHAAALQRMVGLCRRMTDLVRTLDGLAERQKTS